MKRPLLVWLVFAACAVVGGGVLTWFTREMLRLDRESTEARRLAAIEENIRLALWRMDSALAAVHGLEAARPPREYEPFFAAQPAYLSDFAELAPGSVLLPSPLLGYTPPFVRLHFQIGPDQVIRSPQVPAPDGREVAIESGVAAEQLDRAAERLREFQTRVRPAALEAALPGTPAAPFNGHALAAAERYKREALLDEFRQSSAREAELQERQQSQARPRPLPAPESPEAFVAPPIAADHVRDEMEVQQSKSAAEQVERSNTLVLSQRYTLEAADNRARSITPTSAANAASAPAARSSRSSGRAAESGFAVDPDAADIAIAAAPAPTSTVPAYRDDVSGENELQTGSASDEPGASVAEADANSEPVLAKPRTDDDAARRANQTPTLTEPLHALWVNDELVLARRAMLEGRPVIQGAWLDWPELQAWLTSRIGDLLPNARLQPVLPGTTTTALEAARRLAFLPAQLLPGAVNVDPGSLASPLRLSITIAWSGAFIGLVALALLLRGTLRLSERRAAFVSAVTHELRTPLTTFRMYTEMLAGGMVQDETKRRHYVGTLHQESERLSHLVENVLSYARLERGRAAARVEDTTPAALLARIEERLRQRAQQGGLELRVDIDADVGDAALRTDTTAVEQVLFNLVDNATKYGRPRDGAGTIALRVARLGERQFAIRVCDRGPGLTFAARKRLFQPFSKSATEAAHTQPGVGLGLALCRRLARDELHGDLVLERSDASGTVFRLELPAG